MNSLKQKLPFTGEITIYNVLQYVYKNLVYAVMFFLLFFAVGYSFGDTRRIQYQVKVNIRFDLEDHGDALYRLVILNSFFRQLEVHARKMEPHLYSNIRYGEGGVTLQEVLLTGVDKDKSVNNMMSLLSALKILDTEGKRVFFAIEGFSVSPQHKGRSAEYNAVVLGGIGSALGWIFAGFIRALRKGKKRPTT